MGHTGTGLGQDRYLTIVQPHGVSHNGSCTEYTPVEQFFDRPVSIASQRLLDLPDALGRVDVQPGVELVGQVARVTQGFGTAVEEVLEPDPGPHPALRRRPVGLEQATV